MHLTKKIMPIAMGSLLLAGLTSCGTSVTDVADIAPSGDAGVQNTGSASPSGSMQGTTGESASSDSGTQTSETALGPPVTVNIIMDVDRDGTVTDLLQKYGEQGWCQVTTILDSTGGQAVVLEVDGVDTPFSAKFVASSTNGPDLPCQVEAVIPNVPSGAATYVATQTGSTKNRNLAGNMTVTGEVLAKNGNLITLK